MPIVYHIAFVNCSHIITDHMFIQWRGNVTMEKLIQRCSAHVRPSVLFDCLSLFKFLRVLCFVILFSELVGAYSKSNIP